jgi:hypothetical protein
MENKNIIIGAITVAVGLGFAVTGDQVLIDGPEYGFLFEDVAQCEEVVSDIEINAGLKILDYDQANLLVALQKTKCSSGSPDISQESKDVAKKIILDKSHEKFYYSFEDYKTLKNF